MADSAVLIFNRQRGRTGCALPLPRVNSRFRDLYATGFGERRFWANFGHLLVCRKACCEYVAGREREILGRGRKEALLAGGTGARRPNPDGTGIRGVERHSHRVNHWRSIMTLMKSILLGSAAGIVAVAGAQAADLPTKKAAPAEYVKICNVEIGRAHV